MTKKTNTIVKKPVENIDSLVEVLQQIKEGDTIERKKGIRRLVKYSDQYGAKPIFQKLLKMLELSNLSEDEKHLMLRILTRMIRVFGKATSPFAGQILTKLVQLFGREHSFYLSKQAAASISNLSKAVGIRTMMIVCKDGMRNENYLTRRNTAKVLAIAAASCGVTLIFPLLVASSGFAGHGPSSRPVFSSEGDRTLSYTQDTCAKIITELSYRVGYRLLPDMTFLVDVLGHLISRDNLFSVRTSAVRALGDLAIAVFPYGFEVFKPLLEEEIIPAIQSRNPQSNYLSAFAAILPLMDPQSAYNKISSLYRNDIFPRLLTNQKIQYSTCELFSSIFKTPGTDLENLVQQKSSKLDGLSLLDIFFETFWRKTSALDRRLSTLLKNTTVSIAEAYGPWTVLSVFLTKQQQLSSRDSSAPYIILIVETISKILDAHGVHDLTPQQTHPLMNKMVDVFQHVTFDSGDVKSDTKCSNIMLLGLGGLLDQIVAAYLEEESRKPKSSRMLSSIQDLSERGKQLHSYLTGLTSLIKNRLKTSNSMIREQAADFVHYLAPAMVAAEHFSQLGHLASVLYEARGDHDPLVLGSILRALDEIFKLFAVGSPNYVHLSVVTEALPLADLIPNLLPILRSSVHDKVKTHCILLIGTLADLGSNFVPDKEWMRICYQMLDELSDRKRPKKSVINAIISSLGRISLVIGPHEVLVSLLDNLKSTNRTSRITSTIAISVVGNVCGPFSVLPGLMNEYRYPDINVQNGVLKTLSFLFETIGPLSKDFIYSIVTLIEDALIERDIIHRQHASQILRHLALGCFGHSREDALLHLLNCLMPNILETLPHTIRAVEEAFEALTLALGPGVVINYIFVGLFHPQAKLRSAYWRLFHRIYALGADQLVPAYPRIPSSLLGPDPNEQFSVQKKQFKKQKGILLGDIQDDSPTSSDPQISKTIEGENKLIFTPHWDIKSSSNIHNDFLRTELELIL